jgi:hypothetical protein
VVGVDHDAAMDLNRLHAIEPWHGFGQRVLDRLARAMG